MRAACVTALAGMVLLSGCGPTAQEQHLMDQEKCTGFGYQAGSQPFADCMMTVAQQRQAEQAAAQRAAAASAAAQQRQNAAIQAAKQQADQDAWDRRTGQGIYSSGSSLGSPNPIDPIRDSVTRDMQHIDSGGVPSGTSCTTTSTSSGSANNLTTTSQTNCR